jgi:hypothetical protein
MNSEVPDHVVSSNGAASLTFGTALDSVLVNIWVDMLLHNLSGLLGDRADNLHSDKQQQQEQPQSQPQATAASTAICDSSAIDQAAGGHYTTSGLVACC